MCEWGAASGGTGCPCSCDRCQLTNYVDTLHDRLHPEYVGTTSEAEPDDRPPSTAPWGNPLAEEWQWAVDYLQSGTHGPNDPIATSEPPPATLAPPPPADAGAPDETGGLARACDATSSSDTPGQHGSATDAGAPPPAG